MQILARQQKSYCIVSDACNLLKIAAETPTQVCLPMERYHKHKNMLAVNMKIYHVTLKPCGYANEFFLSIELDRH
jgi:hypothetical protein